eukprot:gene14690-20729_t
MVDPDSLDDPCPICYKVLQQPLKTECGHRYCEHCIAEHFFRQHFILSASRKEASLCPLCRQTVKNLLPSPHHANSSHKGDSLKLQVGHVTFTVALTETVGSITGKVSHLFGVSASSMKLIYRGRTVTDDGELASLAKKGATLMFLSTRRPPITLRERATLVSRILAAIVMLILRPLQAIQRAASQQGGGPRCHVVALLYNAFDLRGTTVSRL